MPMVNVKQFFFQAVAFGNLACKASSFYGQPF